MDNQKSEKSKKEKKIIFSEEIDSRINGFALVLAFASIGIFLLFFPSYFGSAVVTNIVRWIFIVIGILGLLSEFGKSRKDSAIKGTSDLSAGLFCFGIWIASFIFIKNAIVNTFAFFFLIMGAYGVFRGLISIIYSLKLEKRTEPNAQVTTDILLLITKIASFGLVILQIIKALAT